MIHRFFQALGLLTRLPVPPSGEPEAAWGRLTGAFPWVGLTIGAPLFLLALLSAVWPFAGQAPLVGPALLLAGWCGLTGALHLDGWGDCCDAFFTPVSRERRLEIMADPRMGSFGVVGLVLLLLLKFAALHALLAQAVTAAGGGAALCATLRTLLPLLLAPALARGALVAVLADRRLPLARPQGMGACMRDGLGRRQVAGALLGTLLAAALLGWRGLALLAVAWVTAAGFGRLARQRIGGLSGDVLGAMVELAETAVLVVAALAPGLTDVLSSIRA